MNKSNQTTTAAHAEPTQLPDFDFESTKRFATEDDFFDDCPICEMMRKRIRSGEKIEIIETKFDDDSDYDE